MWHPSFLNQQILIQKGCICLLVECVDNGCIVIQTAVGHSLNCPRGCRSTSNGILPSIFRMKRIAPNICASARCAITELWCGHRSGERETETNDGVRALAGKRAGAGALRGHAERAGLEHLAGGAGVKCTDFRPFSCAIPQERSPDQ